MNAKSAKPTRPKTKPKVSVLVPIYNVEKYLPECLESLISQTLSDLEIICINDGSTDSSPEILKEYAEKDPRIIILTKPNSGYGDSMNKGLSKARGKYIGIVESDDWIEPTAFEELYELAETNSAEVVRGNYYHYAAGKSQKYTAINPAEVDFVLDPHDQKLRHIFYQAPAIWSALYRKDFLEKHTIKFLPTPGASYQDTSFNFKVWASAHKVYFTNAAYLHYRTDNESSSVKSLEKANNIIKEYAEIERFLKQKGTYEELAGTFHYAKFAAFYWNTLRLPRNSANKFLKTFRKEFRRAAEKNEIDWKLLPKKDAAILKIIIHHPTFCFHLAQAYRKSRSKLLSVLSSVHKLLRPSYRRECQIILRLNALSDQNEALTRELKRLKQKIKKEQQNG